MFSKIRSYLYTSSLVLLVLLVISVSVGLFLSNNKVDKIKRANDDLVTELSILKDQVKGMQVRLDTMRISEKIVDQYVEKREDIEDRRHKVESEVRDVIINDKEACDWWNTPVPDSVSSALGDFVGLRRDEVCD